MTIANTPSWIGKQKTSHQDQASDILLVQTWELHRAYKYIISEEACKIQAATSMHTCVADYKRSWSEVVCNTRWKSKVVYSQRTIISFSLQPKNYQQEQEIQ